MRESDGGICVLVAIACLFMSFSLRTSVEFYPTAHCDRHAVPTVEHEGAQMDAGTTGQFDEVDTKAARAPGAAVPRTFSLSTSFLILLGDNLSFSFFTSSCTLYCATSK
jgi:hypothetical protein